MTVPFPRASGAVAIRDAALFALTLAGAACATNPATGQRELSLMGEGQEISTGQQMDGEIHREMGLYGDRELQDYVSGVGVRLAQQSERPSLPWHFSVVDVPAVNAFALPGGYIYITRGILPFLDNEAQLAGVLGHEVGHVTARHASQQYSRSTGATLGVLLGSIFVPAARPLGQLAESGLGVLFLKYGRGDELQADALGVRYASKAGWDPAGIPAMLTTLGRIEDAGDSKGVPNWLSTHPAAADRVERVQEAVREAEVGATPFATNRDAFLRRLDGVVYGDNPEQGVVRGRTFLHTAMRFAVDFPTGWAVQNGQSQVVAKRPGGDAFVVLQTVPRPSGGALDEAATRSMQGAGFRFVEGRRTSVNGLEAFAGTYAGTLQSLGRVTVRAVHLLYERNLYMLAGVAAANALESAEREFGDSLKSFRPLTRGEAENIHPNRIDFYTARPGDTWQSIASRQSREAVKPTSLAIMNGHAVNDQPRPGERLKIVVGG